MEIVYILITLVIGGGLGYGIRHLVARKEAELHERAFSSSQEQLRESFKAIASDTLQQNNEHFLSIAQQKLTATQKEVVTDLGNQKSVILKMVEEIRKDIQKKSEHLHTTEKERVASFSALKEELERYRGITQELKSSTEQLKQVLSNNQLRGVFGEQIAENLLKMAGFVVGQDYVYNKQQETTSSRPDFTIFLPDKTKINVDVKFPFASLLRAVETTDEQEKIKHIKVFEQDVKQKIKQITSRDYINPQENTVDFAIMFIPNEMIFSYIYEKLNSVWEDALRQKVILCGPFTFTAFIRMVKQSHAVFTYQKNLQNIIGLIQKFGLEYEKYSEAVDTLGKRIKSVDSQFDVVSGTRDRMLTRIVDKIQHEGGEIATEDDPSNVLPIS